MSHAGFDCEGNWIVTELWETDQGTRSINRTRFNEVATRLPQVGAELAVTMFDWNEDDERDYEALKYIDDQLAWQVRMQNLWEEDLAEGTCTVAEFDQYIEEQNERVEQFFKERDEIMERNPRAGNRLELEREHDMLEQESAQLLGTRGDR